MRSQSHCGIIECIDASFASISWMKKLFQVLLCTVFFFFYCEVDGLWTFSDSSWPYLRSCQTFHTNSWGISCYNETEKRLLQQWNVRVWNHICTKQEVFMPCWVTPTSPQYQRRVLCFSSIRIQCLALSFDEFFTSSPLALLF